jgi:hypothetical protein
MNRCVKQMKKIQEALEIKAKEQKRRKKQRKEME